MVRRITKNLVTSRRVHMNGQPGQLIDAHVGSVPDEPQTVPPDPVLPGGVGRHLDHHRGRHPGQHDVILSAEAVGRYRARPRMICGGRRE